APPEVQKAMLLPVPFFHVTGCHSIMIPALANGSKIVLMYKWNAEAALELIERERINGMSGVPSMTWQLLESPDFERRDSSSLEGLSYGGAASSTRPETRCPQVPSASSRSTAATSSKDTGTIRRRPRLRSATDGIAPATS